MNLASAFVPAETMFAGLGCLCATFFVASLNFGDAAADDRWSESCKAGGVSSSWAEKIVHAQNVGVGILQTRDGFTNQSNLNPATWTWTNYTHSPGLNVSCMTENGSTIYVPTAGFGPMCIAPHIAKITQPMSVPGRGVYSDEMYWISDDSLVEEFRLGAITAGQNKESLTTGIVWGYAMFKFTNHAPALSLEPDYHTGYQIVQDFFCYGSYRYCRAGAETQFRMMTGNTGFKLGKEHYTAFANKVCTCDTTKKCTAAPFKTCADVKAVYQGQGCCGNPMKTFAAPATDSKRRLAAQDDVIDELKAFLDQASSEGGPSKAKSLASSIIDLANGYRLDKA